VTLCAKHNPRRPARTLMGIHDSSGSIARMRDTLDRDLSDLRLPQNRPLAQKAMDNQWRRWFQSLVLPLLTFEYSTGELVVLPF